MRCKEGDEARVDGKESAEQEQEQQQQAQQQPQQLLLFPAIAVLAIALLLGAKVFLLVGLQTAINWCCLCPSVAWLTFAVPCVSFWVG